VVASGARVNKRPQQERANKEAQAAMNTTGNSTTRWREPTPRGLAILVGVSLFAQLGVIAEAGASDKTKKGKRHVASRPVPAGTPRPDRYHELLADKMPVGTSAWWEQMRREGRLGGETP
jgi:hypothetical protein